MNLPHVQLVRQIAPQPTLADVPAAVRAAWLDSTLARRIRPGMRVAVGCGSRGIKNYLAIAKATIDALKHLGAKPFVVAAMGSHGGATPDGQRELLASYHIDEAHLGVPVVTDMDAVRVGTNSWGEPVWWDQNALAADGVVLVNRVKPHTDFRGRFESGLLKMLVIGLGKRHGADQVHSYGTRGLRDMLVESGKVLLEKTPFLGGLAVLENAVEETARVEVIDRDELLEKEPPLLEEAKRIMGRIPFPALDVLIVGECGKNYSGAGMDPNVVGRMLIEASPEAETNHPRVTRMACLDVSPESHGNATGIGIADLTTDRALAAIEQRAVPHEQPDGTVPVAKQVAARVRHRPRGDSGRGGHLLEPNRGQAPLLRDPEHTGSRRDVGVAGAGGRGEAEPRPGGGRRPDGVALRRGRQPGAREAVPALASAPARPGPLTHTSPVRNPPVRCGPVGRPDRLASGPRPRHHGWPCRCWRPEPRRRRDAEMVNGGGPRAGPGGVGRGRRQAEAGRPAAQD